jgi:hypothetical protein
MGRRSGTGCRKQGDIHRRRWVGFNWRPALDKQAVVVKDGKASPATTKDGEDEGGRGTSKLCLVTLPRLMHGSSLDLNKVPGWS